MNIRIGFFSFLLALTVLAGLFLPAEAYGDDRIYTVQRGETLYSIARSEGIKADDLMKYNGITDPSRLQAGQRLKIPGTTGAANSGNGGNASAAGAIYRVVRGDTLYGIARKYSVTIEAIREANSLPANFVLRIGDALTIPLKPGAEQPAAPQTAAEKPESAVPAPKAPAQSASAAGVGAANTNVPGSVVPLDPSVIWPVTARELSYMTGKLSGVVITGTRDEQVKSLTWGTVLSAGPYRGFGRVVIVQVEGGYLYVYGGCENLSVKEGDKVGPGTELGKLGVDVVSNKPQLFFMVYRSNNPIDPAKAPRA